MPAREELAVEGLAIALWLQPRPWRGRIDKLGSWLGAVPAAHSWNAISGTQNSPSSGADSDQVVGTQPAHAPGVVPYQELPEALPEEVPEALPVEPAVVPEAGPVAGGPVEPAVPPPAVPQPAAPAEEPAVAPVIPQQRGTAAPARLWRAVSRWWNGD